MSESAVSGGSAYSGDYNLCMVCRTGQYRPSASGILCCRKTKHICDHCGHQRPRYFRGALPPSHSAGHSSHHNRSAGNRSRNRRSADNRSGLSGQRSSALSDRSVVDASTAETPASEKSGGKEEGSSLSKSDKARDAKSGGSINLPRLYEG